MKEKSLIKKEEKLEEGSVLWIIFNHLLENAKALEGEGPIMESLDGLREKFIKKHGEGVAEFVDEFDNLFMAYCDMQIQEFFVLGLRKGMELYRLIV